MYGPVWPEVFKINCTASYASPKINAKIALKYCQYCNKILRKTVENF